jgi:hypothetical protein
MHVLLIQGAAILKNAAPLRRLFCNISATKRLFVGCFVKRKYWPQYTKTDSCTVFSAEKAVTSVAMQFT